MSLQTSEHTEHTPLLEQHHGSKQTTNKLQLLLILLGRLGEATTFTVAFPFVNFMIAENGIVARPEEVGYVAGFIEGIFPFAEFLTVVPWTKLSDKIGRKPVQIIALSAVTVAAPCFGLSHTLAGMLISRAIAGGFNGNIAVCKTAMIENTDESSRAYVFSLEPVAWVLGSILGPWLGGYLSKPAERWPDTFGHIPIFVENPYFLPCLAAALIPGSIALLSAFFLKETLHTISEKHPTSDEARQFEGPTSPLLRGGSLEDEDNSSCCSYYEEENNTGEEEEDDELLVHKNNVKRNQTHVLMASGGLAAYASMALVVLAPLMAYTPISSGGLSLSPSQIGTSLSLSRFISLIIVNMIIFPWIQKYLKAYRIFQFQLLCYPIISALYPLINVVASSWKNGFSSTITVPFLCALQVLQSFSDCSFVTCILILRQLVHSSQEFNGTNAWMQSIICLVRSFAPPLSTIVFAFSIEESILGGYGTWLFLGLVSCLLFILGLRIRDPEVKNSSISVLP